MSEKNVYVFASRWGEKGISYKDHCLENNIVFINNEHDSVTNFPKIARGVNKGDVILLRDGEKIYGIGIANNDAFVKNVLSGAPLFTDEKELNQYDIDSDVDVVAVTVEKWYILTNDDRLMFNLSGLRERIKLLSNSDYKSAYKKIIEIYTREKLEQKMCERILIQSVENLLLKNRNLILTGTPGTGKTKLAKQTAIKMIFGEDISYEEVEKDKDKKAKFEYQCKFVQFHPSYDYTDFVEGIRPVTKGDNTYGFERKDGIFKEFCKRAIIKIEDVKEFCDFVSKRISDNQSFSIKNISEQENNSPITFIEYDDNGVRVVADTKGNQTNGFSKKSYNELYEYYKKYVNNYVGLKEKSLEIFKSNVGVKEGEHTYIHGFLHAMYEYFHKPFIFIIDEINRGDINKILGELFFSIDPGYRGEEGKVETQYQNLIDSNDVFANGFYIPKNVYIIGTMNDIDRSVESIDFAIRRRFAWKEIKPEDTCNLILKNLKFSDNIEGLNSPLDIFKEFNDFIAGKDELGEMYQIGAAYFLKLNDYIDDGVNDKESIKESYRQLWNNHLKGLIHEYVRGKKSANIIFEEIENKYWELTGLNYSEINKIDG